MFDQKEVSENLSKKGYEYIKLLGKGGFSNVLLCHSKKYNQEFAIKRTIKNKLTKHEYNNLILLNHTNIIRLYDAFNDETSQYLVMDYCPYGTIRQKGKVSYEKFVHYSKQILEALAYCHYHQIAHRDIKPENIFLDQYDHIKLGDFGMAKHFDHKEWSSDKCGTFKYFAPEMFQYEEVDPFKADIWALGITFFFMATGNTPFHGSSREEIEFMIINGEIDFTNFHIDKRIQYLIKKMTMKSPHHRPTVKNLLELEMIKKSSLNDKSNCKSLIQYHRIQSCNNLCKSMEFELKANKSSNDQGSREVQVADLLSYKNINRFPRKRRLSGHFLPINTF